MATWLWVLENWLYQSLIRSPRFHRGVQAIEKKVREIRHGKDPIDMGGTQLDRDRKYFFKYFVEELKEQFRDLYKKKR